jgi:trk system potassium uptake protein TrkA
MKIVIVGCGRVGSTLAENLDAEGHDVIVFDIRTTAFDRLPETFKGAAIRGDGTDEEVLRRNGADNADVFMSLTEGDNRNVMAAQVALENLAIPQVIAKINDPVRAAAYSELGIPTLCRTNLMVDSVAKYLKLPMQVGPGIDVPENIHPHAHRAHAAAAPAAGQETPAAPEAPAASGRRVVTNEPDTARAQRAGFRRWRG